MKPASHRRWLPWIALAAAYFGIQFYAGSKLAAGPPPPLAGTTLKGEPFDLKRLQGRPAIVYFWASWCSICRAMQSNVGAIAGDYPLITVALQSGDQREVDRYQNQHGFHPPTVLDEDGSDAQRWGVRGVPVVFVLDSRGDIRFASTGYHTEWGLRLRLWLTGRI